MFRKFESRGRMFDSQPEGLGVAFFATGPGLGLIMYILTTLEFPTHNFDFHLLVFQLSTGSVYALMIRVLQVILTEFSDNAFTYSFRATSDNNNFIFISQGTGHFFDDDCRLVGYKVRWHGRGW